MQAEPAPKCRRGPAAAGVLWVQSLGQEDFPGGGHSNPLHGESHGQRSLVGCSPRGHKESDTPEATEHSHIQT